MSAHCTLLSLLFKCLRAFIREEKDIAQPDITTAIIRFLYAQIEEAVAEGAITPIKLYFLLYNKNIRFEVDDELKIGDVRYDNMTQITVKVQLFRRLPYET